MVFRLPDLLLQFKVESAESQRSSPELEAQSTIFSIAFCIVYIFENVITSTTTTTRWGRAGRLPTDEEAEINRSEAQLFLLQQLQTNSTTNIFKKTKQQQRQASLSSTRMHAPLFPPLFVRSGIGLGQ